MKGICSVYINCFNFLGGWTDNPQYLGGKQILIEHHEMKKKISIFICHFYSCYFCAEFKCNMQLVVCRLHRQHQCREVHHPHCGWAQRHGEHHRPHHQHPSAAAAAQYQGRTQGGAQVQDQLLQIWKYWQGEVKFSAQYSLPLPSPAVLPKLSHLWRYSIWLFSCHRRSLYGVQVNVLRNTGFSARTLKSVRPSSNTNFCFMLQPNSEKTILWKDSFCIEWWQHLSVCICLRETTSPTPVKPLFPNWTLDRVTASWWQLTSHPGPKTASWEPGVHTCAHRHPLVVCQVMTVSTPIHSFIHPSHHSSSIHPNHKLFGHVLIPKYPFQIHWSWYWLLIDSIWPSSREDPDWRQ